MLPLRTATVAIVLSLWFICGCSKEDSKPPISAPAAGTQPAASPGTITLAVIPKGTTHSFWKSVEAGANKAAQELGVQINWKGPLKENDRAQQIQIVEQFVAEGVNGIVLAPLDDTALRRPVQAAMARKIPVVIFDSALVGDVGKDFVSFVATDNKKGGAMGGEQLARLLNGKGKVVLLRYQEGSASTMEREAGFLEVMKANPGIQMTVDNRYAGPTSGDARSAAMSMLDKLKEADGIFCPNESSTYGMLLALRQAGIAGKAKFVGFDASGPLVDALKANEIDALVSQNPMRMGYEGVKTAVQYLRGEKVPERIDTGVELITRDNLNDPRIKALVGTQ